MSMWSLRWHFTNRSATGAPYNIKVRGWPKQTDRWFFSTVCNATTVWNEW